MPKHIWVQIEYTPIEPELTPDGKGINVYARHESLEAAKDNPAQGCWICGAGLSIETINTECEPVEND